MRKRLPCVLAVVLAACISGIAQANDEPPSVETLLAELIRIDTSNPPGHEAAVADFLAAQFRPLGAQVEIIQTPAAGKAHFLARLRGDGSARPVLLAAHADVVGVERAKWSLDPFGGVVKQGYVFGRGAIDFKGGLAVFTAAVLRLAREKVPLTRDVILLAEADEESGATEYNTTWLAENHWPRIDCEFALNEGGWIIKGHDGRARYVSISTADKRSISILLTARGQSTHSSMPLPDSAIFLLARALDKLADHDTEPQLLPSTRQFFEALARTTDPPLATHLFTLAKSEDRAEIRRADREVSMDPLLHALLRNTFAPVIVQAGFRKNVIPGSAEATINMRLLPGTDPAAMVAELQRIIHDPRIDVRLDPAAKIRPDCAPSSQDTALYRALSQQAARVFPSAIVTPCLFQAGTDATPWRSRGIPVYGTYPYPIDAEDLGRMHGNDERVSVESLRQGVELIYGTLVSVAARH